MAKAISVDGFVKRYLHGITIESNLLATMAIFYALHGNLHLYSILAAMRTLHRRIVRCRAMTKMTAIAMREHTYVVEE